MTVLLETTDAADSTATTYTMGPGDYFHGTLDYFGGDNDDWVAVTLEAGHTYTFGMTGIGALDDGVDDSYLYLRDSAGVAIDADDDSGPGSYSNLTYTAATTGTYYLHAGYAAADLREYGLSMVEGDRASYDVQMGAGVLTRSDRSWSATTGTPVTVTWGVRESGPAQDADGKTVTFEGLTPAQIAAAQSVLDAYAAVCGLTFTQVNPGGTTNDATMLFGGYTSTDDGAGAYAYYPGSTAASSVAGDVWLNNDSVSQTSLPSGSYSLFALGHEVGHAVGLSHPGDYNAAPGVSITYAANAQFIEDSHQYTVMSYFDESNTTSSFSSYPDGLLLYDIYALQQLYGANMAHEAGDSVYGFNSTVGGIFDFAVNTSPVLCIWDGGGEDVLDVSGYAMDQVIRLGQGLFSDIGGLVDNVSIAIGAVIENAIGGIGNDGIFGNAEDNALQGRVGNDTMDGGEGNDALAGQRGNDWIYGGDGHDTMVGGYGDDVLIGNAGKDQMFGGVGDDVLKGRSGTDYIVGDVGDDTIDGGSGADILYGNAGKDSIFGGVGSDWVHGGAGTDVIDGWSGDDTLLGGGGADLIYGSSGDDDILGGDGADTLNGGVGRDTMTGGSGPDVFEFAVAGESPLDTPDLITDFETGLDRIDLSVFGLTVSIGGTHDGIGPSAITEETGGDTRILVDADGDGLSDMRIDLAGVLGVTESDFLI